MTRRTLILGGTGWLGREIARTLVATGVDVTCAARGDSGAAPDGAKFVRIDRTVPGACELLDGEWDEVIELAYEPALVDPALAALADRVAHWTLVSTVSVYARNDEPHADESAALVDPADLSEYPDAKVAAERASAERLGDRLLIVRPGLIVGPGDPSDRFGYWPARLAHRTQPAHRVRLAHTTHSGAVLVPATAQRNVQVIDVADLARFIASAGASGESGAVNAVGESVPFADLLALAASVTGFTGEFVTADDEWLLAHDVRYWAGPRSLPLWLPMTDAAGFAQRSNERFHALGGELRPLRETIERVLEDEQQRGLERERRSGLTAREEAELLRALRG